MSSPRASTFHPLPAESDSLRIDRPACGSINVSWRSSPRMPATYQAVAGELTVKPAGPDKIGGANCESHAAGIRGRDHVGVQSHSMAEVEIECP